MQILLYCNAFNLKGKNLKKIGNVITTSEKMTIEGKPIKSTCGGLYLDSSVFKIDKKTKAITKKENETVEKTIKPYCGGILLDSAVFEVKNKMIDLISAPAPAMMSFMNEPELDSVPMTTITFDSIDTFEVKLMDENNNIMEQTEVNKYVVPKNGTYTYEATNGISNVNGVITPKRKTNVIQTLEF